MTLVHSQHMYNKPYGFDITDLNFDDVSNKLFCTFSELDEIDSLIDSIRSQYDVLYNKIFVLQIKNSDEYVCTYNIDYSNLNEIPENTILVHRKKETNTLYTINALNEVVKEKTGGQVDNSYMIDWEEFRNCILTTSNVGYKKISTKVFKSFNTQNLEN